MRLPPVRRNKMTDKKALLRDFFKTIQPRSGSLVILLFSIANFKDDYSKEFTSEPNVAVSVPIWIIASELQIKENW